MLLPASAKQVSEGFKCTELSFLEQTAIGKTFCLQLIVILGVTVDISKCFEGSVSNGHLDMNLVSS